MTGRRCDVLSSVNAARLARLDIADHEAGDDPYVVTEPKRSGGGTRHFCSLAHLALWLRAAATGADRRAVGAAAVRGEHRR